jgi:DNA repair protein RecN (Recombination protein N)
VIEEIRIRGVGVIEDATLEPHAGFTALTGETGAGKTMVLTGLGLLLGGRADAGVVRSGGRAEVEGRLRIEPGQESVLGRVDDAGGELDDGTLVLARSVSAEGRSRAWLGGRSVPAAVLAELADDLVAVHGQSDQQRLLAPARQRAALDRFAGAALGERLAAYRIAFEQLREREAELAEITQHARERAQEADLLRHGLAEVESVAPTAGEWEALSAESSRLAYAEQLRNGALEAHDSLRAGGERDDTDALTLLSLSRRALEAVRSHDPELGAPADRLAEAEAIVADVAGDLASYAAAVEADPNRLAAVEERRAALGALTRKYGDTIDAVLAWAERSSTRLLELDTDDDRRAALAAERDALRLRVADLAVGISRARAEAALAFSGAVSAELAALAMPHAQLGVELAQRDAPDGLAVDLGGGPRHVAFGLHGIDEVELVLVPHPGAPARPIAKGASGGELSRVMLAIEVVFAGSEQVPTLVFDEVDAGVGGAAAVEVGRRLARLARTCQVLVVTHLPQVAAFADRHVVVEKSDDGRITTSGLRVLDDADRVTELGRMLAGLEGSATAAAHADELLQVAAAERAATAAPVGRTRKGRS